MKKIKIEYFIKKPFKKRMLFMLIGVIVMGICVAFQRMCHFGCDPFSALNYGLNKLTGISFGTLELFTNGTMLIFAIIFGIEKLGFGTLGNMILVGYTADFTSFIIYRFFGITDIEGMLARIIVMLISLFIFIIAIALYLNAGLGGSAYDALPFIIHEGISKKTKKKIPFRLVRIIFDAIFTTAAFIVGGEAGIITILMVLTIGPMIGFVAVFIKKYF